MKKYILPGIIAGAMSVLPALSQTNGDSKLTTNPAQNAAANAGAAASGLNSAPVTNTSAPPEAARGGALARGVYPAGPGGRNTPLPRPPRPDPLPVFYDPKLPVQKRVDDLVSNLSLEEKVSLMQMASPSIPRLGIAPYHWWTEALHGMTHDTETVFPQAIGLSATWDTELHLKVATAISTEGRAKNIEYRAHDIFDSMTGLDFWSPNVNIFRDPRWGRGQESYGEDPYLSGRFAVAFVKGIQGDDPVYFKAIATPKHYAVHSGPEPLRHQFDAVVTDQDLYTTYLPQFEAAVREGHAHSVMSAYNSLDGVPDSCNKRLLTDILRTQWGFDGYVVSDDGSVADIYNSHRYANTAVETSALAVKAGNDLDSGTTYAGGAAGGRNLADANLVQAVRQGLITEKEIDVAVGRVMEARIRLGEFDPPGYPGNPYNAITTNMYNTEENHTLALKAARETMVLLKNANHTLPLKTSIGTVAVMGPNANAFNMQLGNYNGHPTPQHQISILDGIRQAIGADHVMTTTNLRVPLTGNIALAELVKPDYLFTDATKSKHGLTVFYYSTFPSVPSQLVPDTVSETGELKRPDAASSISSDPGMAARMTGIIVPPVTGDYQLGVRGRNAFRLSVDGNVVVDGMQGGAMRIAGNAIHLEKDKPYKISIEFILAERGGRGGRGFGGGGGGPGGPAGAAPGGAPTGIAFAPNAAGGSGGGGFGRGGRGGGQVFGATPEAPGVTATSAADTNTNVLLQLCWTKPTADGFAANTAGQSLYGDAIDLARKADAVVLVVGIDGSQEGEGRDRNAIELPAVQEGLVKAVTTAAGSKPVILVCCSGSSIALNWANEHVPAIVQAWYPGQRGDAVADVIFGKYNPAGRLPVTFYKSTADLPAFTNYNMVDRTYRYFTKPVLYPFGYGLSYSTFKYSKLTAPRRASTGGDVKVSVNVKNTSRLDGEEVVQCYLNRDVPAIDPGSLPEASKMTDEQATLAATPRKALVGFARVPLKAGESRKVTFTITTQQLSLVVGKDGKREVRPGKLQIQVGGSSANGPGTLVRALTLAGPPLAPKYHFMAPEVD
jgi:beta-glucosidase